MNKTTDDIHFQKKFGQNFIYDQNLLHAICNDAGVSKETEVLEIGAGSGNLTKALAQHAKQVVSYEIDQNLQPVLHKNLANLPNVKVVYGDILKQSMDSIENHFSGNYVMVANLPYYITTPILFYFVEQATKLTKMTVMVQKEVAERLVAKPNTKDYGVITVMLNAIANLTIARIVKRNMFTPIPNVDSAIVTIEFAPKFAIANTVMFRSVVKSAFAMRRKTLANNLKTAFSLNNEQVEALLTKLGLPLAIRGEVLSVQQFVALANELTTFLK